MPRAGRARRRRARPAQARRIAGARPHARRTRSPPARRTVSGPQTSANAPRKCPTTARRRRRTGSTWTRPRPPAARARRPRPESDRGLRRARARARPPAARAVARARPRARRRSATTGRAIRRTRGRTPTRPRSRRGPSSRRLSPPRRHRRGGRSFPSPPRRAGQARRSRLGERRPAYGRSRRTRVSSPRAPLHAVPTDSHPSTDGRLVQRARGMGCRRTRSRLRCQIRVNREGRRGPGHAERAIRHAELALVERRARVYLQPVGVLPERRLELDRASHRGGRNDP